MKLLLDRSVILSVSLSVAGIAKADAIIISKAMMASTIAEVFITQDDVRLELEIGPGDLDAFRNLMPDELYARLGHEPRPWAERLERFFTQDWVIRPDRGAPLIGRLDSMEAGRRIKRDEITGEPLLVQPKDAEIVVRVVLTYPLGERPAVLTFRPPKDSETDSVAASVGFVVYHLGLPVNDFRYLAGEETLNLDWEDPWYSRFQNRNLRRQYNAPLSVFLYVEHFEVRKEVVIRPKDAQQWLDLGLEGKRVIPVTEQGEIKRRLAEFLADHGDVVIDGRRIEGILDRIHFLRRTLRQTGIVDPPEDLDLNSATLGVIFVYPIEGLPEEVTLEWDLFSPRIQQISSAATDEAGGMPQMLTPEEATIRWQNFLTNPTVPAMVAVAPPPIPGRITIPLVSGICGLMTLALATVIVRRGRVEHMWPRGLIAGCGATVVCGLLAFPYARASFTIPIPGGRAIQPQQAKDVLGDLLHNVYRAFDWRDEGAIYDRLALSITGDLLSDVYLQTRRSMELENQGGARVKVDEVEIRDAVPQDATETGGFVCRCRWNVSGSVGHWGHIHRRINQYDAVFTVEPVDGAWRIAAIDLREETRVDPSALSQAQGAQPMITIRNVEFEYRHGEFHLRIPELLIPDGAKIGLIGPSGSGKTTFLNLVSGIALPRSGSLRVNDQEVSLLNDTARRAFRITNIGFVFQDFELIEYLSVLDNILHPYRINQALRLTPEVHDRAQTLAESTGLAGLLRRKPDQLSHGEKQRAAICRALLVGPRLILADEPTGNLDPANKDRTLDLLIHHAEQAAATLLIVTHDLSLLDRFDEVIDFRQFHHEAVA